ncbi:serine--tRNA ligase, partial [bacterium]
MLDLKFIRENLETVQKGAESKGATVDLPGIMSLDEHRRKLIGENDS